jgi:catechol 2,3-dioxygenase-like lactoylglutathione lyase family enzyme
MDARAAAPATRARRGRTRPRASSPIHFAPLARRATPNAMIDHLSLGTHRYGDAVAFFQRVLAPLDITLQRDTGQEAAFGTAARWSFFLYPAAVQDGIAGARMHVAFAAPSRTAVERVHAAALAAGAQDVFSPRERPDVSPTYYGAMFRSADGHAIEVLTQA